MNITDFIKIEIMKTIKDRAEIFVDVLMGNEGLKSDLVRELLKEVYMAAAMQERELITKWHDAKTDPPTHDAEVLCIVHRPANEIQFNTYEVCRYDKEFGWLVIAPIPLGGWCGADREILVWRDITER